MPQATSTARSEGERERRDEAVAKVAPVAPRERALALQHARRDADYEHDRDERTTQR